MNDEVKLIYLPRNDALGYPQEYKTIKFYPIQIKDLQYIDMFRSIFMYPKDSISEKRICKMSYLKFIFLGLGIPTEKFVDFFKYITKSENVTIGMMKHEGQEADLETDPISLLINDIEFSEYEFDNLREIILQQNGSSIDYVNQYNSELEEKLNFVRKLNPMNFEDELFTLIVLMKLSMQEAGELTLYQLEHIFERNVTLKQFEIYEPLLKSGNIKMDRGKLQSYLYHKEEKDRYDNIMMKPEEFAKIEDGLTGK